METVPVRQEDPQPMDVDPSPPQVQADIEAPQPQPQSEKPSTLEPSAPSETHQEPNISYAPIQSQQHPADSANAIQQPPPPASDALAATATPPLPKPSFGNQSVFRVDQSASAWQTAKDALEAGMSVLSSSHGSQRTGGRRGRGPRRNLSPGPSGSITLMPHILPEAVMPAASPPRRGQGTPRRASRGRGRGRGGRGRTSFGGTKRKRGSGSEEDGSISSSSEEITTLPSQSRSGRKIIQATHAAAPVKLEMDEEEESPPSPAPKRQSSMAAPPPVPTPPKAAGARPQKRGPKRTPGASAVCKNCGRGHSPSANAIVFCDGCNAAWHQHCHDPPIRAEFLLNVDRDWFCSDCVMLREHSTILDGKVAGTDMSMLEKRKYLKTLPPSTLIALLLHATSLHPSLPIFPPKPAVVNIDLAALDEDVAGLYEEVVDELPYPKAGNGIQLRPEAECPYLLDEDTAVYSHIYIGVADMMLRAGWPHAHETGVRTANASVGIRAGGA